MTPRSIIVVTASVCGVSVDLIMSRRRHQLAVDARALAAWAMRQRGHSFPRIGLELRRDHSTIMHHVDRVDKALRLYPEARGREEVIALQAITLIKRVENIARASALRAGRAAA